MNKNKSKKKNYGARCDRKSARDKKNTDNRFNDIDQSLGGHNLLAFNVCNTTDCVVNMQNI